MVKPSAARVRSAESSLRPLAAGFGIGWMVWEGLARFFEHFILSWISERLQEQGAAVEFLKWTIDHPFLFLAALAVLYLAFVCLKAMFGGEHEEHKDTPAASAVSAH